MSDHTYEPGGASPAEGSPPATQQAKDVAQQGKQAAADVTSTATDSAKDIAQEAGAQARDLMGRTRTQVREQVNVQQRAVVENLRSLGDQLAEMTEHVSEHGTAVDLASQARDRARQAADWLDGRDPDDILDELRRVGRNRPGAFLFTAAVSGVLAGRLTRGVVAEHTADEPGAHRAGTAADRPADSSYRPTSGDVGSEASR